MKRRNAECGKMRRPIKRNKITEGIYGSTLLYLKFLLLWAMVILADFILEFRFEFLWPFWMLLRSVYDSFKYQGLAFSVFFVCIAVTSDMICFFFIPVQWVFFAASTYVWVQYVWYTDKGVCLPTLILCTVFVYVEAGVRLRDLRHVPAHLDLCRPFAAHCIGYPVVTLGFGLKSFVGHRMRRRRQREVARENTFYMQLLQQALPPHQQPALKEPEKGGALRIEKTLEVHLPEKHMNGNVVHMSSSKNHSKKSDAKSNQQQNDKNMSSSHQNHTSPSGTLQTANHKDSSLDSGVSEVSSGTPASKSSQNHTAVTANHREKDKEKDSSKTYTQANQNKHTHSNGVIGHQQEKVVPTAQHSSGNTSTVDKQKEADQDRSRSIPPVQVSEVSHADIEMYTEKTGKGSKSTFKWEKRESVNSTREEKRKYKNKDKEANRERELNKEKDSNKDKESLKDKDSPKEKESHKDKDSYKEKIALKEKESHRENEKNSVREKESHKDKDSHREKDSHKDKDSHRDRDSLRDRDSQRENDSQREKDTHKEKDSYKEKDLEKEKYTQKDSRDREINKDGDTSREKELHKEKDSKKERESYKEKDSVKERESKDFYKDKENDFYQKHSEQKESSVQREQLRSARAEAAQLRGQLEQLSLRLGAARAAERAAAAGAERRVAEERRRTEGCRQRRAALEQEAAGLRGQLTQTRDRLQRVERELQDAEQQVSNLETKSRENGPEAWHAALSALRERAQHLERSLSAETRIKLDLFSAVGEAKRQLGLREGVIRAQEKEIDELKGKIAQMLAIMPSEPFTSNPGGVSKLRAADCSFPPLLSHHHIPSPLQISHQASHPNLHQALHQPLHQVLHQGPHQPPAPAVSPSSLDPNATAYTPKGGMVPCGPSSDV